MDIKPFILNSIPKSGTHLLLQVVEGIPGLMLVPPYVTIFMNPQMRTDISRILTLPPNHFLYGHLFYTPSYEQQFKQHQIRQLLMIRDPRDVIVSLYYYMHKALPDHPVMRYGIKHDLNKEQMINRIILGIQEEEYEYLGTNMIFGYFTDWINNPDVLVLRYEDLMDPRKQDHECYRIIYHLTGGNMPSDQRSVIGSMKRNIMPERSGTFRKGTSGEWRKEFSPRNIRIFHENCRELLNELGYL